jgi:hypothetical protein
MTLGNRLIDRRTMLQTGTALSAGGPVLLRSARAGTRPHVVMDFQVCAYAAKIILEGV